MKNFWCEGDEKLGIKNKLKPLYAELKQSIISEMNKQCWIEGKDYDFGYSEINNYPCVFYHYVYINGEKTERSPRSTLDHIIRSCICVIGRKNINEYTSVYSTSLLAAFNINISQHCARECPEFGCLLLCEEELKEAIANEPDRWDFYLAHKDD